MPRAPIRIFKVLFGVAVLGSFAWFCVFWQRTFADVDQAIVTATQCLSSESALCVDAPVSLPMSAEDSFVGPPAKPQASLNLEIQAVQRMFQARIHGPYALSVRDGLNEMVIGSSLLAQGLLETAEGVAGLDGLLKAIPAQLPTFGYISSGFGIRRSPFTGRSVHHRGVDFAVPYGSPVYATADGVVTYAATYHGLGRTVMVDHGFGIVTRYGHNSAFVVREGDHVRRGDVIARAGSTGRSTGSHVHYEVWVNGRAIDPAQFMFDVPERRPDEPLDQVAMGTARASHHHLGLAVGGDGGSVEARESPEPYDRDALFPLNFAIVGLFAFVAIVLMLTLWPSRQVLGRDSTT